MKQIIRLTENDLHNIVRKAVDEAMNEVSFRGQSFHGNNAEDWQTLHDYRMNNPNTDFDFEHKNWIQHKRDGRNATALDSAYNSGWGMKHQDTINQRVRDMNNFKPRE